MSCLLWSYYMPQKEATNAELCAIKDKHSLDYGHHQAHGLQSLVNVGVKNYP